MAYVHRTTPGGTGIHDERDDETSVVFVHRSANQSAEEHDERVHAVLDALNGHLSARNKAEARTAQIRMLANRAISANRIVAATNVSDLEDDRNTFDAIHDMANDLTISTQRALARAMGWLEGSDDMSDGISPTGGELFDAITHGNASDEDIARAFRDATGQRLGRRPSEA
jgi:recombinational DNA repair protein RecR